MKLADAVLRVARIESFLARGVDPRLASIALAEWFDGHYLPHIRTTNRSWRSTRSRFDTHIRPVLGERPIERIGARDLIRLVDGLQPSATGYHRIERLADSTVNRVAALLKALFATLLDWGVIQENPAAALKLRRERNRRCRVLGEAEYVAFFAALAAAPPKVRLLVAFLLTTGVRLSEALAARWEDLDAARRVLHLPDTKSGQPRDVPLSQAALGVCRELETLRVNAWLFPGRADGHLTRPGRQYKAVLAAAGIEGLWLHDLRRTFATVAAREVPIQDVSRLLGHSSVAVTERYVVTHEARLHAAAASVGRRFNPALELAGLAAPNSGEED